MTVKELLIAAADHIASHGMTPLDIRAGVSEFWRQDKQCGCLLGTVVAVAGKDQKLVWDAGIAFRRQTHGLTFIDYRDEELHTEKECESMLRTAAESI